MVVRMFTINGLLAEPMFFEFSPGENVERVPSSCRGRIRRPLIEEIRHESGRNSSQLRNTRLPEKIRIFFQIAAIDAKSSPSTHCKMQKKADLRQKNTVKADS